MWMFVSVTVGQGRGAKKAAELLALRSVVTMARRMRRNCLRYMVGKVWGGGYGGDNWM